MSALRSGMSALRNTLRNCEAFQAFVGAVGHPDEADKHIYEHWLQSNPDKGDKYSIAQARAVRPYALLSNGENGTIERKVATGERECSWLMGGVVMAEFARDVPEDTTDQQQVTVEFEELIGAIVDELKLMADQAGYLDTHQITSNGPFRTAKDERAESGDAQFYYLSFSWGPLEQ